MSEKISIVREENFSCERKILVVRQKMLVVSEKISIVSEKSLIGKKKIIRDL